MEKLKRSLGSFVVPLLSIILAFVIGGIIMAALGAFYSACDFAGYSASLRFNR